MAEARLYTIDLSKAYQYIRTKRARRSVALLRSSVARYTKTASGDVRLSEKVNALIWEHSMSKPPRRIKIKVEQQDGKAYVRLPDEKPVEKKAEEKKGEKPKAEGTVDAKTTGPKTGGKASETKPAEKYAEKPREASPKHVETAHNSLADRK